MGAFSQVWLDPDGWERRDIIMREKIRPAPLVLNVGITVVALGPEA